MLTGYGVFGEYLLTIGRELTSICHHCGEEEDTAQHTLEFCPGVVEESEYKSTSQSGR
jgi:hypothetical protein